VCQTVGRNLYDRKEGPRRERNRLSPGDKNAHAGKWPIYKDGNGTVLREGGEVRENDESPTRRASKDRL